MIADIPGTEFPDEYVIVGGHIDSWDGATGTCDNGTGCSTTLEAARILMKSGVKPRRTIRFMLWSGEEQGLLGSRAYVKAHPELMPKISAVLVHDGGTNYLSGIGATKAIKKDIDEALAPIIGLDANMPFAIREVARPPQGSAATTTRSSPSGVPGFFWRQSGKANYNHIHHTQYDTYDGGDPRVPEALLARRRPGGLGVADLDHLLSRDDMSAPAAARHRDQPPHAGVQLDDLKVAEVVEGGLAEKAGFKAGDVIFKVGDKAVTGRGSSPPSFRPASPKKITVKRDGKEVELSVTFPAEAVKYQSYLVMSRFNWFNKRDGHEPREEDEGGFPAGLACLQARALKVKSARHARS